MFLKYPITAFAFDLWFSDVELAKIKIKSQACVLSFSNVETIQLPSKRKDVCMFIPPPAYGEGIDWTEMPYNNESHEYLP